MIFSFWLFPEKCNSWWFSVDYPLLPANSGVLSLFTVDTNNFTSEKMRQTSGELKKMPKFLGQKWTSAAALTPPVVLNSETKSLKIDPKVPNQRYRRGLQTGHWRNPGSYSKKRIFGPKSGPVAGKRPTERPLKIDHFGKIHFGKYIVICETFGPASRVSVIRNQIISCSLSKT